MKLSKRARDGIWMLVYNDDAGKRKRISTGTRDRAEAERQSHLILAGQGPRAPGYTLGEALDSAWQRRWKNQKGARQLNYVVAQVKADLGKLQCRDLTYSVMETYVEQCEDAGLAAATINHRLGTVSVALDMAAKRNKIPAVPPMPRCKVQNRRLRYISKDEEALLLKHADPIMEALIKVLLDTGCRLSEITCSTPADVVDRNLRLIDTKNGKSRAVPLTVRAKVALAYLHVNPQWQAITRDVRRTAVRKDSAKDWCVKHFTRVRNAAGLPDVSLHILRHTCASRLVEAGVDLYRVKEWLGHSTITMTERYAHLSPDALSDVVSVLEQPTADVVPLRRNEWAS